MAFSTLALKEMIIKSTIFLILIHLTVIKVSYGHSTCPGNLVPCLNQTHCINIEQVCVDYHDCVDEQGQKICHYCPSGKSDSIACVTRIEHHPIFECLSPNQICDTIPDCINNEDEYLCGIEQCQHDFWLCKCIEKNRICDRHKDCPYVGDEEDFCHSFLCGPDKIRCPTGACIPKSKICDGVSHCSDGYDEQNCPHLPLTTIKDSCSIPSNTFTCSTPINPICISNDRICDGYKDCPKGDDEYNCNNNCTSKSICIENSDVTCIQHPVVDQLCRCVKQGYQLINQSSQKNIQICQDFNECNDSFGTYCSFTCRNTDGSFTCTCPSGFSIDEETKTCRRINNQAKPNLLILFDDNIILYNILNNNDHYSLNIFNKIHIEKTHRFDHIQYDPKQMFVIYYDQNQHAILCKSSITLKTLILLSNIIIHGFAYNANEKTLFIIENQSQTLRMYTPITCDRLHDIKMHSWSFNNISNSIQSMEIDVYNRQIIFGSQYEFLISNMSKPNLTKVVYSTDRKIKRFIYDTSFKRIFWTTINKINDRIFSVYTCNNEFKKCYDTSIFLSSAWPFAFFNDGLLYRSSSLKSLQNVQIYGKYRFEDNFIASTKENIGSFLFLDYQQTELSNLCMQNSSIIRCKDKICLQINSTEVNCLSIDENIISNELITSDNINSDLQSDIESLVDDNIVSQLENQRKKHHYRLLNTIVFCFIILGVLLIIFAFFVKYYYQCLNKKILDHQQRQSEQCLSTDEPNLDEFNVIVDDRVSKQYVDYTRAILLENSTILLTGRPRDYF